MYCDRIKYSSRVNKYTEEYKAIQYKQTLLYSLI